MKVTIEKIEDPLIVDSIKLGLPMDKKRKMAECFKSSSKVWIGLVDNKVACVWGIALPTLLSDNAYLWLWASEIVREHPFIFVRRAQIVVKKLLEEYSSVEGVVEAQDPQAINSIRWLKLLGAKFGDPSIGGLIPFQIRKA